MSLLTNEDRVVDLTKKHAFGTWRYNRELTSLEMAPPMAQLMKVAESYGKLELLINGKWRTSYSSQGQQVYDPGKRQSNCRSAICDKG